jgi:hypothetical protein
MAQKQHIDKVKNLLESKKNVLKYLYQFLFIVAIYGVLINFALSQFTSFTFSIKNIIAMGIAAYIIKVELPPLVSSCFPKAPPSMRI